MDPRTIFNALKELKDVAYLNGRHKIAITHDTIDPILMRKMIEVIFLNTDIEISIHSLKRDIKKPQNGTETILINNGTKSYAETLKALKNKINVDDEGFSIAGVKASKKGEVLVSIKGDTAKASSLSTLINTRLTGAKSLVCGTSTSKKVLHLKFLDGDVTADDINKAIVDHLPGTIAENIVVKALRPAFAGRQNATVIAPAAVADKLIASRSLRIGWGHCRIIEREDILQCYRCRVWAYNKIVSGDR